MNYSKPPLTWEQKAQQLLDRGLIAEKTKLITCLKSVNYYRLSGYLYPFRNPDDSFKRNTSLDTIWRRYTFDRRLRLIVLDAIERFEISLRTNMVYFFAHRYGQFGYTDASNLPKLKTEDFNDFIEKIKQETQRSREPFKKHFFDKYGDCHSHLPIWMVTELMSFGLLLSMFRGIEAGLKKTIAKQYGITDKVLLSWIVSINGIRNICAHHSRLWNRVLGYKPFIPRHIQEFHKPVEIRNNKIFGILTILRFLLKQIAPQSKWMERLFTLLKEYNDIPINQMGFPDNWKDCPIWK